MPCVNNTPAKRNLRPRRLLSRVTLVYSCLVSVFCTTNVFCILYSAFILLRYANNKDRRAKKIINDKKLDIDFKAITFGTYGAFGKSTHSLIKKATADAQESVFCPWVAPGPRQHAYLLFGFSLARANARMLINADSKRRSARNSVRTSRPQPASAATVHG